VDHSWDASSPLARVSPGSYGQTGCRGIIRKVDLGGSSWFIQDKGIRLQVTGSRSRVVLKPET
jgi:hypothetical protein